MNTSTFTQSKESFHIEACGCEVKVFSPGQTPRVNQVCAEDTKTMKGIHTHFTYEVFFVVSGNLKLVTDLSTTEYHDSVIIIPPKLKHYSAPEDGEAYCLLFSFANDSDNAAYVQERLSAGIWEMPITSDITFYIRRFCEKLSKQSDQFESDAYHLVSLIFSAVFFAIGTGKREIAVKKERLIQHIAVIEEYINRNINKKITLADLAAALYLSPKQISRIIEQEYGCTFSELMRDKRLASAALLLKNTDMKIAEIAEQTFYGAESYFYSVFKEQYGVSPLAYRRERQEK